MRAAMLEGSQDSEHHPIHVATGDDKAGVINGDNPKQDTGSLKSHTETNKKKYYYQCE